MRRIHSATYEYCWGIPEAKKRALDAGVVAGDHPQVVNALYGSPPTSMYIHTYIHTLLPLDLTKPSGR